MNKKLIALFVLVFLPGMLYASSYSCAGFGALSCRAISLTNTNIIVGGSSNLAVSGISGGVPPYNINLNLRLAAQNQSTETEVIGSDTASFYINITSPHSITISASSTNSSSSAVLNLSNVASGFGPWSPNSAYPISLDSQSCVLGSSKYIYCVGGFANTSITKVFVFNGNAITIKIPAATTNQTFYGVVRNGTITDWIATNNYPTPIYDQSCVAYSSYIYCVGGGYNGNATNSAYFAKVLGNGQLSGWNATSPYPKNGVLARCTASAGYIYCSSANPSGAAQPAYYASLSPLGIGNWQPTSNYPGPSFEVSCFSYNSFIYCIIRDDNPTGQLAAYFAPISDAGIGQWTQTKSPPLNIYTTQCALSADHIYCIGGTVRNLNYSYYTTPILPQNHSYYTQLSSKGMSDWATAPNYPTPTDLQSCLSIGNVIYCIGGWQPSPLVNSTHLSNAIYSSKILYRNYTVVGTATLSVFIKDSTGANTIALDLPSPLSISLQGQPSNNLNLMAILAAAIAIVIAIAVLLRKRSTIKQEPS